MNRHGGFLVPLHSMCGGEPPFWLAVTPSIVFVVWDIVFVWLQRFNWACAHVRFFGFGRSACIGRLPSHVSLYSAKVDACSACPYKLCCFWSHHAISGTAVCAAWVKRGDAKSRGMWGGTVGLHAACAGLLLINCVQTRTKRNRRSPSTHAPEHSHNVHAQQGFPENYRSTVHPASTP